MQRLLLCITFIISVTFSEGSECGQRPTVGFPGESRVIDGHFAQQGAWPWQVSIQLMNRHICGGSILNHHWILTAAHCFNTNRSRDTSKLQVLAGLHSLSKKDDFVQQQKVGKIIRHEKYNRNNYDNDVALLHLPSPLHFTSHVQPVCLLLSEMEERNLNFSSCYISGWGSTVLDGKIVDTLHEAEVELINTELCNQMDWYKGHVSNNMVCAGMESGQVDTCQGDSGGPLSCYSEDTETFYLYGITSHGEDCGLPKRPGVYVRLNRYSAWLSKMQQQSVSASSAMNPALLPIIYCCLSMFI